MFSHRLPFLTVCTWLQFYLLLFCRGLLVWWVNCDDLAWVTGWASQKALNWFSSGAFLAVLFVLVFFGSNKMLWSAILRKFSPIGFLMRLWSCLLPFGGWNDSPPGILSYIWLSISSVWISTDAYLVFFWEERSTILPVDAVLLGVNPLMVPAWCLATDLVDVDYVVQASVWQ